MTCNSCVRAVQSSLSKVDGIGSFRVELENQRVYIDSLLPDSVLLTAVEASGRRARIVGHSTTGSDGASLGAAVAEFKFTPCQGVVRFTQLTADNTLVEGLVSGLAPNARHGLQVHEYGDLSEDWRSVGPAFGASASLGDIESDEAGKGSLIVEVPLKVSDIIGRSLVVHTKAVRILTFSFAILHCGSRRIPRVMRPTRRRGLPGQCSRALQERTRTPRCSAHATEPLFGTLNV